MVDFAKKKNKKEKVKCIQVKDDEIAKHQDKCHADSFL